MLYPSVNQSGGARRQSIHSRASSSAGPDEGAPEAPDERWLARHRQTVAAILIAAAVIVRVLYYAQLSHTELIGINRLADTDMSYYDGWGRTVADGDWRSASVGVPMHSWQIVVANQYFETHPDDRAALERQAAGPGPETTAAALLWTRWMEGHRFYEDPLYAYAIGVTYRLVGPNPSAVLLWQLAMGVGSTLLIWSLARRFFGEAVGVVAGALAVLCAQFMYYELLLLRESAIVFTGLLMVWLAERAWRRDRWTGWAGLGLVIGLGCLLKTTFVILAAAIAALTVIRRRGRLTTLLRPASIVTAAAVLALAPLVARNVSVGVPPLALASSGPMTFMIGNATNFVAERGFSLDTRQLGTELSRSYGHPMTAVLDTLRAHTPASLGALLWRKWALVWHGYEVPNNDNFSYMRLRVPVLAWLPITFAACGPLGLAGLMLALARRRRPWPLLALVATTLAPLVAFYVLGRFRVALLAALLPFAALTIVASARWALSRRYVPFGVTVAALALIVVWTGGPPLGGEPAIRAADWLLPYQLRFHDQARHAAELGNPGAAADALLTYFQYEPDIPHIVSSGNPELARGLSTLHHECADLLRASGRAALARVQEDKAESLARLGGTSR